MEPNMDPDLSHTLKAGKWTPTVPFCMVTSPAGFQLGTLHGAQHGPPRYLFDPGSWKPAWNPTWSPTCTPTVPFCSVTSPISWKLETNMEPNKTKPRWHNPRWMSVLREPSLAASLWMSLALACSWNMLKPTWNPTGIENWTLSWKHLIILPHLCLHFIGRRPGANKNNKNIKRNPSPLRHSALFFLGSSCIGECFPQNAWVESGLVVFLAYHGPQEPKN